MTHTETRTRISQVGTVFVPVADQGRVLEFYLGNPGRRQDLRISSIVNPAKLTHLGPVADLRALLRSAR
jgi:hypothetical protein